METTEARERGTAGSRGGRGSARARGASSRERNARAEREELEQHDEYDLLTAMLVGLAVGVTATMLMRRGPRGVRPISPMLRAAGSGAMVAGKAGWHGARVVGRGAARGAEWAAERGADLWDAVPRDEIAERVNDYLSSARDVINETVSDELRDLRKAIRRQRKRLGV